MKKYLLFSVTAILLGIIFSLTFAEITLRILGLGYGNAPLEADPILHHKHPVNYTFLVHTPNKEFGGYYVHYDAEGLSSAPNQPKKDPGLTKYRIAIMGDSFAEATQVPFEESFAGLIEKNGENLICKNYGVGSYSPVLYLLQWRLKVARFNPTHVFVLLFSNDIGDDERYAANSILSNGEITAVPGPANDWIIRTMRKSYLVRFLRKIQLQLLWLSRENNKAVTNIVGGYVEESPAMTPLTEKLLLTLAGEVKAKNAQFILMVVPSKYHLLNRSKDISKHEFSDIVKDWAGKNGVDFLDLVPCFQKFKTYGKLYYDNDFHFNKNGHRAVFEAMRSAFPYLFE